MDEVDGLEDHKDDEQEEQPVPVGRDKKGKGKAEGSLEQMGTLLGGYDLPKQVRIPIPNLQHTMLAFAAGVSVKSRGGVGVVTKETVHFHEASEWKRVREAEKRQSAGPRKRDPNSLEPHRDRLERLHEREDQGIMKLCVAALEKRGRGYKRNLHQAGGSRLVRCSSLGGAYGLPLECLPLDIDRGRFGFVDSRYRPAWKTKKDRASDERHTRTVNMLSGNVDDGEDEEEDDNDYEDVVDGDMARGDPEGLMAAEMRKQATTTDTNNGN
ncbi:hypothetical protein B0I37DRAFT_374518 [Chaetomium sp. MPI-CAGE-AT-0009]|nr:hypothetical protein B0I37DRAFT_374518 [Chaetomium sp. MPI-CAGE-AT-0009]